MNDSVNNTGATETGRQPIIGITCDIDERDPEKIFLRRPYIEAVSRAGGVPLMLPPVVERIDTYLAICHGFIFTGGDDPIMEAFGGSTHPKATKVDPTRQAFETTLMRRLFDGSGRPMLGICLGMQYMALLCGGDLDQYLPDTCPTYELHWGKTPHPVTGELGEGEVLSHHRQAVRDPGALQVAARAPDGMIEAVIDPNATWMCLGVQWHPERSGDHALGDGIFNRLIGDARSFAAMNRR